MDPLRGTEGGILETLILKVLDVSCRKVLRTTTSNPLKGETKFKVALELLSKGFGRGLSLPTLLGELRTISLLEKERIDRFSYSSFCGIQCLRTRCSYGPSLKT